ncbi:MAG: hypothetical protein U5L02_09200 [Rheinheimera sp.]|nr:hypothetical protein [Rheinheimera sp.]
MGVVARILQICPQQAAQLHFVQGDINDYAALAALFDQPAF